MSLLELRNYETMKLVVTSGALTRIQVQCLGSLIFFFFFGKNIPNSESSGPSLHYKDIFGSVSGHTGEQLSVNYDCMCHWRVFLSLSS